MRWQDRPAASSLPSAGSDAPEQGKARGVASPEDWPSAEATPLAHPSSGTPAPLALGTYRDLWAGPITELNPPLRFLEPQQRVELSIADAERLSLKSGDEVDVSQNGTSLRARVSIKEQIQEGACFLIEGTAEDNANSLLNGSPVAVEIAKVGA